MAADDDGVSKGERRSSVLVPSDRSDRFAADTAGDVCDSIGSNGAWLTIGRAKGASELLRGRLASGRGRPAALPSPVELPFAGDFTVLINSGTSGAKETIGRAGVSGDDEEPLPLDSGAPFHSPVVSAAIISLDPFVEAGARPPSAPRAC